MPRHDDKPELGVLLNAELVLDILCAAEDAAPNDPAFRYAKRTDPKAFLLTRDHPGLATRRATFEPSTLDREARTVEVIASTGAPVNRVDQTGPFVERLAITDAAIDLTGFVGAAVLDSHRQEGVDAIVGTVQSARIEGGQLVATIRIATGEPGILDKIAEGVIRAVSIGYSVETWDEAEQDGQRTRTATRWAPRELSLVAVPADPGAMIRGGNASRSRAIRTLTTESGLGHAFADDLIDRGATLEQARAAAAAALVARGDLHIRSTGTPSGDDPEIRARAMGEALFTRHNPGHTPSAMARSFTGWTIREMAEDCLVRAGSRQLDRSPTNLVTRALHTTSDFPLILGSNVGRSLRQAYDQAESGIRQLSRETSVRDFRARSRLQLSSAPVPLAVLEGGEYQGGTFAEAQETYSAARFGRMIGISIETLVNDDVGAFNDLARRFGQSAAAFEAQFLVDLLTSNAGLGPVMADTEKLFDAAAHGNIPSSSAIDEDALSAARLAMRSQTGLVGEVITVTPRYLLVPPALETTAEKIVATIQAATTDAVNPFTNIRPIVEPRLTNAAAWYLVADPASIDGLEHTYVEGMKGPTVETERDFTTDGLRMKVRMTYGAGFVDWRGWQRNAGG